MPKNIMFCFDGTNNDPNDAVQETSPFGGDHIKDSSITNVLKLHLRFGGNLGNTLKTPQQHSFYYPGVGTYGGRLKKLINMALALPIGDVRTIISAAREDLKKTYEPGDQIFIFGFSRGAAIARRFASKMVIESEKFFQDGRIPDWKSEPVPVPVRFLGVFDTVASIGLPDLSDDDLPDYEVKFQGGFTISPAIKEALHLVSIDENRKAFKPTLMNQDGRVTEVWFPGVHSDIGGGYWRDFLSDVTLEFMLGRIRKLQAAVTLLEPNQIQYANLAPGARDILIEEDDLKMNPSIQGTLHEHERDAILEKITLSKRNVEVWKNDRPVLDVTPLVIEDIKDRVKGDHDYAPAALRGIAHRLISMDGVIRLDPATGMEQLFTGTRNYP